LTPDLLVGLGLIHGHSRTLLSASILGRESLALGHLDVAWQVSCRFNNVRRIGRATVSCQAPRARRIARL
jgi:hypothetical protein